MVDPKPFVGGDRDQASPFSAFEKVTTVDQVWIATRLCVPASPGKVIGRGCNSAPPSHAQSTEL